MITRRVLIAALQTRPLGDQPYYVSLIIIGPLKANHELVQSPSQAHFKEENEKPAASFPFPIDRFRKFSRSQKKQLKLVQDHSGKIYRPLLAF